MIRRALLLVALSMSTRAVAQVSQAAPVAYEPPAVPREFRAAWVTPLWDRGFKDWPSAPGLSPDSQRAELRTLLDHAASIGLNAVILHVRLAGDALYPTNYAPWSAYLSGTSGTGPAPMYDPLAYAVTEAHARGLQLHAWFNPFRAMLPIFAGKAAPNHVTRTHPDWIVKYGSQTWIDPGNPAARKYVLETVLDVVKRYDVDGVHLDDYFYP
ncbi:MAG TPA: family 10 glycosylhydrolase, partial [Gemmatimonadaceae bacterium]